MESEHNNAVDSNLLKTLPSAMIFLIVLLLLPLSGCYQMINVNTIPDNSDKLNQSSVQKPLPPAYLKSIQVEVDGTATNEHQHSNNEL